MQGGEEHARLGEAARRGTPEGSGVVTRAHRRQCEDRFAQGDQGRGEELVGKALRLRFRADLVVFPPFPGVRVEAERDEDLRNVRSYADIEVVRAARREGRASPRQEARSRFLPDLSTSRSTKPTPCPRARSPATASACAATACTLRLRLLATPPPSARSIGTGEHHVPQPVPNVVLLLCEFDLLQLAGEVKVTEFASANDEDEFVVTVSVEGARARAGAGTYLQLSTSPTRPVLLDLAKPNSALSHGRRPQAPGSRRRR